MVTLPDLRGIVTGVFEKMGLLEVEDLTEHRLLDSMETTGSTGTLSGEFDYLGFLYIVGSKDNMLFFFDLKMVRVRLTSWLNSMVAWSKLW